jgi:multiple sugar transport system ATP-binding protein
VADVTCSHLAKTYPDGTRAVTDLSLAVADGELVVIVGPSGCGKSTVLRLVAGLETPTAGSVAIGGKAVDHLPPQRRDVAMVFQGYALYPHLTVAGNLAFPLKARGLAQDEVARRVAKTARMLALEPLLDRRPAALSGGERQRVAMGRALVRDPAVFLLDEPLSNLDAALRVRIRTEIAALQRRTGTTTLYVTHDQVEAMTLGDRVAVMERGRLCQVGTPRQVYDAPADTFVARFIGSPGMNLLAGRLRRGPGGPEVELDGMWLPLPQAVRARQPGIEAAAEGEVIVGLRPEALAPEGPGPRLKGRVAAVERLGHAVLVHVAEAGGLDGAPVVARLPAEAAQAVGEPLELVADPEGLRLFGTGGAAL